MALPLLLVPLVSGAATVIGGGMSMVGGAMSLAGGLLHAGSTIASVGASAVSGLAGAAGGMLGGGESGNVQRDDGGGERVYGAERFGSKTNTANTPGGGSKAIVVPQTSMTGSQSIDSASSEGSSPQEILMSIFKSMQQSLLSIDNTLRSMLNVDAAILATEQKSNIQDNLDKNDTDPNPSQKPPGFFSRVGSKVKDTAKRATSGFGGTLIKALGLGALITLFVKYKEQITAVIEKIIGYVFDLGTAYEKDGFAGVFEKIGTDFGNFFNDTLKPLVVSGLKSLMSAIYDLLGLDNPFKEVDTVSGDVVDTATNPIIDALVGFGDSRYETNEQAFAKANDNLLNQAVKLETTGDQRTGITGTTGSGPGDIRLKNAMSDITKSTAGKVTWSKDLNDDTIPIQERLGAKAIVDGKEYTLKQLKDIDFSLVPPSNFELINDKQALIQNTFSTLSSDYRPSTDAEQLLTLREDLAKFLDMKDSGNDSYAGVLGGKFSTDAKIQKIQAQIKNIDPDAIIADYDADTIGNSTFLGGRDNLGQEALDTVSKNNKTQSEKLTAEIERLRIELENQGRSPGGGPNNIVDASNTTTNIGGGTVISGSTADTGHNDGTANGLSVSEYSKYLNN